jgi:hypothetical protein
MIRFSLTSSNCFFAAVSSAFGVSPEVVVKIFLPEIKLKCSDGFCGYQL